MIELRALGAAEIRTDLTVITPSQEIVFAAALYLILERGTPVSRIHLASLLWPHGNDGSRRHRLRQTILQLKKLGFSCHADRTHIRLSKDAAISGVVTTAPSGYPLPMSLPRTTTSGTT